MAESFDPDVRSLQEILRLFVDLSAEFKEPNRYILVTAIELGTTFSGYAFSFTSDKDNIMMNKNWGNESGCLLHKTDTSVLLNPTREFLAFGFEASMKYTNLEDRDAKEHYYFHRFMMKLQSEKTLSQDTTVEDVNGKKLPALDIFAHAIRYLKDHMLEAIKLKVSSNVTLHDNGIRWVLTVPAIWDDSVRQFMTQAAYKAGIASHTNEGQLLIMTEPEATEMFCRYGATQTKLVDIKPGDRYMILDCGERTVDITVYEFGEDCKVKEVTTASGGDWGGTKVDEEFLKLLDAIFGADIMAQYKVEHPNEYLNLLDEIKIRKRSALCEDSGAVIVHLLYNFYQFYPEHTGGRTVQQAIKQYNSEQVIFTNGTVRISHSLMKSFFTHVIDPLLNHISSLLTQGEVSPLKYMFMVGGFSESPILQHAIKEKFQSQGDNQSESPCSVIVPEECGLAIVKGAVMFGHNPSSIAARKSKYTYGTGVCSHCEKPYPPPQKKRPVEPTNDVEISLRQENAALRKTLQQERDRAKLECKRVKAELIHTCRTEEFDKVKAELGQERDELIQLKQDNSISKRYFNEFDLAKDKITQKKTELVRLRDELDEANFRRAKEELKNMVERHKQMEVSDEKIINQLRSENARLIQSLQQAKSHSKRMGDMLRDKEAEIVKMQQRINETEQLLERRSQIASQIEQKLRQSIGERVREARRALEEKNDLTQQMVTLQNKLSAQNEQMGHSTKQAELADAISKQKEMNSSVETETEKIKLKTAKIAKNFTQIESKEWVEAKEALDERFEDDRTNIQFLLDILECACQRARKVFDRFLSSEACRLHSPITSTTNTLPTEQTGGNRLDIPGSIQKEIMAFLRGTCGECDIESLIEDAVAGMNEKHGEDIATALQDTRVRSFVQACCRLAWQMAVQQPPLTTLTSNTHYDDRCHQLWYNSPPPSKSEGVSTGEIDFYIWPELRHSGTVLQKGRVCLKPIVSTT